MDCPWRPHHAVNLVFVTHYPYCLYPTIANLNVDPINQSLAPRPVTVSLRLRASMSQQTLRKPYNGLQRKIVIAFDIGTTFSGASYALLIPGEPPVIQGVTQ